MTETRKSYFAGILDTKGAFSIRRNGRARLQVASRMPEVLALLKEEAGGSISGSRWTLEGNRRIVSFLNNGVGGAMQVESQKEQARCLVEYCHSATSEQRRRVLRAKMRPEDQERVELGF